MSCYRLCLKPLKTTSHCIYFKNSQSPFGRFVCIHTYLGFLILVTRGVVSPPSHPIDIPSLPRTLPPWKSLLSSMVAPFRSALVWMLHQRAPRPQDHTLSVLQPPYLPKSLLSRHGSLAALLSGEPFSTHPSNLSSLPLNPQPVLLTFRTPGRSSTPSSSPLLYCSDRQLFPP